MVVSGRGSPLRWLLPVAALLVGLSASQNLPNVDLQGDGEAIFCKGARFGREEHCREQWRYAMALTCGPKCHAMEAVKQSEQAMHFSAVAKEGCSLMTQSACLTTCLTADLLSERYEEIGFAQDVSQSDPGLVKALQAVMRKPQHHGDRWFYSNLNSTDLQTFVLNTTLTDPNLNQARRDRLDEFWKDFCTKLREEKSGHRKKLCPASTLEDRAEEINFDYLDQLKDKEDATAKVEKTVEDAMKQAGSELEQAGMSFLQMSPEDYMQQVVEKPGFLQLSPEAYLRLRNGKKLGAKKKKSGRTRLLQTSPEEYLKEVEKHSPKRIAMKALKQASGDAGRLELLKVKKFLELSFLRQKQRLYECEHPAILAKLLAQNKNKKH